MMYALTQYMNCAGIRTREIISVCDNKTVLEKMAEATDKMTVIPEDNVFSVVPEDIYNSWPQDEGQAIKEHDKWAGLASEYKGYKLEQYITQYTRCCLFADGYEPCEIEEVDVI